MRKGGIQIVPKNPYLKEDMMENLKKNKAFMYILSALLIVGGVFMLTGKNPVDEATAVSEEVPFYSDPGDNLFMVDGYGDLVVGVIRKDDGSGYGPLGFCLAKPKFFPGSDNILYSNVLDKGQWSWDLGDGRNVTAEQAARVDRAIYAFNFVYNNKLADYGLAGDDTMSLYHAAQIAIWSIAEGWNTNQVVKDPETAADADLNALADKIHALYTDIYNYAVNDANPTFEKGSTLLNVTADSIVANGAEFNLAGTTQHRADDTTLYYRTPLLSLVSNQDAGLVWSGDYAYRYKVELVNAPAGTRVVNELGAPQTEFSTEAGVGSDFYIEVPVVTTNGGTFQVNVTTTEFRRMDTVLWHPITATGYQSLMQVGAIPDTGSANFKVTYTGLATGQMGRVGVIKVGEQLSGFTTYDGVFGTEYHLEYETLPLKGAQYLLFMGETQQIYTNMTDGQVYVSYGQMFRNPVTTGEDGKAYFEGLPLNIDNGLSTQYIVREVKAPNGFVLNGTNNKDNEKVVQISSDAFTYYPSNEVTFTNERIHFTFKTVNKILQNADGKTLATEEAVFGIYTNEEIPTYSGTKVPKDALVAVIRSDANGKLEGKNLNLPAGYDYYLQEIEAPNGYVVDKNKYYIDSTIPSEISTNTFEVVLKDKDGKEVTEIVNHLPKYTISVQKQVQSLPDGEFEGALIDNVVYKDITSPEGYKFGIYKGYDCSELLQELTAENYSNGKFVSSEFYKDGVYCIKELESPNAYYLNETPKTIILNDNTTVVFENDVKTGSITVNKYDITYHRNNPENGVPQDGVKFKLSYNGNTFAEYTTEDGKVVFEDLPLNACYTLTEIVPAGYISETETQEICLNGASKTLRVNNYLSEIKGTVEVTKLDSETGAPLEGVQFGIYESTDTNLTNPLAVDTTDENGKVYFRGMVNKSYLVKEIRVKEGYIESEDVATVDMSNIMNGEVKTVTIYNSPYYGKVRVTKSDATDGAKLADATFGLYDSTTDVLIEEKTTDSNGQIIFSKQPYGSLLYVKEKAAPDGYQLSDEKYEVAINDTSKTYYDVNATNAKIEKTVLTLVIVKTDTDNRNLRLSGAEFTIYPADDMLFENLLARVTTNSEGEATIEGLEPGKYMVLETKSPAGYLRNYKTFTADLTGYSNGETVELTIYNTKEFVEPVYTTFTVNKVWAGDEGYNVRPESISVQLMNGETEVGNPVRIDESMGWTYTWTNLDANGDWTIKEINVPERYTSVVGNPENNSVTVTNIYTPKPTTELTINKVWSGDTGYDVRPESVEVQLLNGNEKVGTPITLSEENNWTYTWKELDAEGDWKVAEINLPARYSSIISDKNDNKISITNLYTPEPKTELTVNKVWVGDEGYNVRPSSVEVQLMDGSTKVGEPVELSLDNGWTYTWTDLDIDGDWTVAEVELPERYECVISENVDNKVTITNIYTPIPTIDLTVEKKWVGDERYNVRPESVIVQLLGNGSPVGARVELTEEDNWTYTWTGLNGEMTWTIEEIAVPERYTSVVSNIVNGKITVTNTYEPIPTYDMIVEKKWVGDEGYNDRPLFVEIQLMNGENTVGNPVRLSSENNWTHTYAELEIGQEWQIKELNISERYTSSITYENGNAVITNTYVPIPTTELTVVKEWVGDEGYNVRPESVRVQLMDGNTLVGEPVELSASNNWTYTWTELDVEGEWTVKEVELPERYECEVSETINNKVVITNTYTPIPTFDLTVEKKWVGDEGYNARPEYIEIQLMDGNTAVGNKIILNTENNWTYVFEDIEAEGHNWTIDEVSVPERYEAVISEMKNDKIVITNTYTPIPTFDLIVEKQWIDDEGYGVRPFDIEIQLMDGNTAVGEPVKLSEGTNWTYTFKNLEEGRDWTVAEVRVPAGYTSEISEIVNNKIVVKNTFHYVPEPTTELTVVKKWVGDEGYNVRPESVTVQLMNGEEEIGEPIILSETNNWTYKWEELDIDGNWTVKEIELPERYECEVSENINNKVEITNTYTPIPTFDLIVEKVWVGDEGYNDRPEYIEIQLMDGNTAVGETIELSDENGWAYTYVGLEEGHDWKIAEITISERYTSSIERDGNKVVITNTYIPVPTTELTVVKEWIGDEGYGVRPTYIDVQLMDGTTPVGQPVRLSASNNWTYTWTELDVEGGWTVKEVELPERYECEVSETINNKVVITNTYTPIPTFDLTVEKKWVGDEGYNARPEYIEIQLMDGNTAVGNKIILNAENNWTYVFEDIEAEGHNWTIDEVNVPERYEAVISEMKNDKITITNTYTPAPIPTIDLVVKKEWVGDAAYGVRPEYIEVQLIKGTEEIGELIRLSAENNWTYVFEDLEEGYQWNVTEKNVPAGYSATISRNENEITITNEYTYVPEPTPTTELTAVKVWKGDEGYDVRPDYIEIQLVEGTTPVGNAIKLSEENDWTYAWTELDATKTWSVIELNVPAGYTANISTVEDKTITITNEYTYVPEPEPTFDLTVEKKWVGDEGKNSRPETITIQLMKNAKAEGEAIVLSEDNDWTYTWKELNATYSWTVMEINPPRDYNATISYVEEGKIVITNTYNKPSGPGIITPVTPKPTPTPTITERPKSGVEGDGMSTPLFGGACLAAGLWSLLVALKKRK